ncbi:unnamed protein product, partial [Oikopleura dioica]
GFDCFFFHDVDLVAENDENIYECLEIPRHYSGYIDIFNYTLLYDTIFGGITAFSAEAFEKINGYSNEYWGWGGEDDDLERRTMDGAKYNLTRPAPEKSHYKMIKHDHEASNQVNPYRKKLLKAWKKHADFDGLNNLNYELIERNNDVFFKNITVDLKYSERIPLEQLLDEDEPILTDQESQDLDNYYLIMRSIIIFINLILIFYLIKNMKFFKKFHMKNKKKSELNGPSGEARRISLTRNIC